MGNSKSVEVKDKGIEKDKLSSGGGSNTKKASGAHRGSGSLNGSLPKKPLLNASQRSIIKYCLDNAKEDMADRIVRRVGEKKEDFKIFIEALPKEEKQQYLDNLKEFLTLVCTSLTDSEFVQKTGFEYGQKHANLRTKGFKPDFFAGTADAVTTECTFLDGATHAPSETAGAWSELSTFVFSNVRDGYYQELRKQRKNSNTFQSKIKLSEMAQESRDDDLNERGASPIKNGCGETSGSSKEGSPHFVLPPNAVC